MEITKLYRAGLWKDLAQRVLHIGFSSNLSYYFLGRSAEELGHPESADLYYRLALTSWQCPKNFLEDQCEGVVFPAAISERLIHIADTHKISPTPIPNGTSKVSDAASTFTEINAIMPGESSLDYNHKLSPENKIELIETGGVYEIPITLNDVLKINVILDSGASDVSISPDVALTLMRTGTIQNSDWLPGQTYSFADGSKATSARFRLKSIAIGNKIFENITCVIANSIRAPMLLGQSALRRLGKYSIDYDKRVLQFD
jgi:aspartyl protease family protein